MKKTVLFSALIAMGLASQAAQAGVSARVGAGSSTYTLGGDYITGKSKYTPVTVGLTFSGDSGLYMDMTYTGGNGTHDAWASFGSSKEDFKRSDFSLIAGSSQINESGNIGNIYFGIKAGQTDLNAKNAGLLWTVDTFKSSGFVFGGGIAFPIAGGDGGVFGLNGGIGLMGATWSDDTGFSAKADSAVGASFGLSYSYQLQSWLGLTLDYKAQAYNYKFGPTMTVKESVGTAGAALTLRF